MERIICSNIAIETSHFVKFDVIVDDYGKVILLPLLWSIQINNTGTVFSWSKRGTFGNLGGRTQRHKPSIVENIFDSHPVSPNTIKNYVGHLFNFLKYINELHKTNKTPSVHNSELISSNFINNYLNYVLPERLNSSASLVAHQAAISAYFNFIYELEIKDFVNSSIFRKTNQYMAEKDCRPKKINYVSKAERSALLMVANNVRDRLIIRTGFEVGLRTEENLGLVLSGHKAKFESHKGLLEIFEELDDYPLKDTFDFVLNGKYTKRGVTRTIYFKKDLLTAMKRYYDTERYAAVLSSKQSHDTLFVRLDNEGIGLPICEGQGSNVFTKLRLQCPFINEKLSYHDLRHSFATELYHAELADSSGQETRSESAALIVVAERLGHQNITSTIRYIRLRQQMIMIENAPFE